MVRTGLSSEQIREWGGDHVFAQAIAICNSGEVRDVCYDEESRIVSGRVLTPGGGDI